MKDLIFGEQYKGMGNCGTKKGVEVIGELIGFNNGLPILKYATRRTATVSNNSLTKLN